MGYTLKLDIFYFSLRKITKEVPRKIRGGGGSMRIGYLTEKEDIQFSKLFAGLYKTSDVDDGFKAFLAEFVNKFGNEFKRNTENTQAVSVSDDQMKEFNSANYTIWGQFKGGPTGIEQEIYYSNNSKKKKDTIDKDNVASLHYYYKLWIPYDSNVGVLMLQSYTTTSCSTLYRKILDDFFISHGYKADWAKCIPQEYIKKYISNCYIYAIKILTKKKLNNASFEPLFESFKSAKQFKYIERIRLSVQKLMSLGNYISVLKSEIAAIDASFDTDNDDLMLFYKDNDGKRAHATLSHMEDILPNIILDDSLKDPITQRPKWDELHAFTNNLLDRIKSEISYTPKLK